jgi:hypothetical protein
MRIRKEAVMAFWERVREDLKKAAKEGWEVAKGGVKVAAEKGKEISKIEKLRLRAFAAHRRAEKLIYEFGGAVYEMAKPPYENPFSDPKIKAMAEEIKKLEGEVMAVDAEIKAIKEESAEKRKKMV